MLTAMRGFAKSRWAGALLLLLAAGFALWGINDVFTPSASSDLASVGGRHLTAQTAGRRLDEFVTNINAENNGSMTREDAVKNGVARQVVDFLIQNETMLAYADKIGVRASARSVALEFKRIPALSDGLGGVDPNQLAQLAQRSGLDVKKFSEQVRADITTNYLQSAAFAGMTAPDILVRPWFVYENERRLFSAARIADANVPEPADPSEEDLKALYAERSEAFREPERRRLSVLAYSTADFLDKAGVTEETLRAEYEKRKSTFAGPETREIVQAVATQRGPIQDIVDRTARGEAFAAAAGATADASVSTLTVKKGDIANETFSEAAFRAPLNTPVGPLEVEGGWVVFQVTKVTPGEIPEFGLVRDTLEARLAETFARKAFEESEEDLLDLIGNDLPIDRIAAEIGAPLFSYASVDADGALANGQRPAVLAASAELLQEAFSLGAGETSSQINSDGAIMMVRVDSITPARLPPIEEIRPSLVRLWKMVRKSEAAEALATEIVASVRGGKTLKDVADASKLGFAAAPAPMSRRDAQNIDPGVIGAAFSQGEGEVSSTPGRDGAIYVVQTNAVIRPDEAAISAGLAEAAPAVRRAIGADIGVALTNSVATQLKARVNEKSIEAFLKRMGGEAQSGDAAP